MSLKDHTGPKKDWDDKQWLEYAWIQRHNPWISEDDREYWRDKISDLTRNNHSN